MDIVPIEMKVLTPSVAPEKAAANGAVSPQSLSEVTDLINQKATEEPPRKQVIEEQELELNKALRKFGATELKVELRDGGEGPVFHIVDKQTGKELLQIPSEYKLSIERTVEMLRGALFDKRV